MVVLSLILLQVDPFDALHGQLALSKSKELESSEQDEDAQNHGDTRLSMLPHCQLLEGRVVLFHPEDWVVRIRDQVAAVLDSDDLYDGHANDSIDESREVNEVEDGDPFVEQVD